MSLWHRGTKNIPNVTELKILWTFSLVSLEMAQYIKHYTLNVISTVNFTLSHVFSKHCNPLFTFYAPTLNICMSRYMIPSIHRVSQWYTKYRKMQKFPKYTATSRNCARATDMAPANRVELHWERNSAIYNPFTWQGQICRDIPSSEVILVGFNWIWIINGDSHLRFNY